jgi:hypothetical protein
MPFWLYAPAFDAGGVTLSWSPSFHLRGQPLRYDVEINRAETFDPASVVVAKAGIAEPRVTMPALGRGRYFWRAVARAADNPAADWQVPFNDHQLLEVS